MTVVARTTGASRATRPSRSTRRGRAASLISSATWSGWPSAASSATSPSWPGCSAIRASPPTWPRQFAGPVAIGLNAPMLDLTRRRNPSRANSWLVCYGDLHAGTIGAPSAIRVPRRNGSGYAAFTLAENPCEQRCGQPTRSTGPAPRSRRPGSTYLPRRTEADFQAWRDHQAWTEEKYRRFDRGERDAAGLASAWRRMVPAREALIAVKNDAPTHHLTKILREGDKSNRHKSARRRSIGSRSPNGIR